MKHGAAWVQYLTAPTQAAEDTTQDPYGVRPVNSSEIQAQAKTDAERAAESAVAWISESGRPHRGRLAIVLYKVAFSLLNASGLSFSLLQDVAENTLPKCYSLMVQFVPAAVTVDWEEACTGSGDERRIRMEALCNRLPAINDLLREDEADALSNEALLEIAVESINAAVGGATPEVAHAILISCINSRPGSVITLLGHCLRRHKKDRAKYTAAAVGVLLNAFRRDSLEAVPFIHSSLRFLQALGDNPAETQTDDPHSVGSLTLVTLIVELVALAAPLIKWDKPAAAWERDLSALFRLYIAIAPNRSLMHIALSQVNVVTALDDGLGSLDTAPITYARVFNLIFLYDRYRQKESPALLPKCYSIRMLFLALVKCTYVVLKYDANQQSQQVQQREESFDYLEEAMPVLLLALGEYSQQLPQTCFDATDTFIVDIGEWIALLIYGVSNYESRGVKEKTKNMRQWIQSFCDRFIDVKIFRCLMGTAEKILTELPDIPCRDASVAFLAKLHRNYYVSAHDRGNDLFSSK